jgi:hypothetical protein
MVWPSGVEQKTVIRCSINPFLDQLREIYLQHAASLVGVETCIGLRYIKITTGCAPGRIPGHRLFRPRGGKPVDVGNLIQFFIPLKQIEFCICHGTPGWDRAQFKPNQASAVCTIIGPDFDIWQRAKIGVGTAGADEGIIRRFNAWRNTNVAVGGVWRWRGGDRRSW